MDTNSSSQATGIATSRSVADTGLTILYDPVGAEPVAEYGTHIIRSKH